MLGQWLQLRVVLLKLLMERRGGGQERYKDIMRLTGEMSQRGINTHCLIAHILFKPKSLYSFWLWCEVKCPTKGFTAHACVCVCVRGWEDQTPMSLHLPRLTAGPSCCPAEGLRPHSHGLTLEFLSGVCRSLFFLNIIFFSQESRKAALSMRLTDIVHLHNSGRFILFNMTSQSTWLP